MPGLLADIRDRNLNAYRAMPGRLQEDVAQEAEIAHDYQGRLLFELLQNADDAMEGVTIGDARVVFRLTDTDLWMANTGRPLDEADVRGLCGTGASTKAATGPRRASIGHKGMGFKSVLEITDAPMVLSSDYAFRMDRELASRAVKGLFRELGEPEPRDVAVMRFPWEVSALPPEWDEFRGDGHQAAFRFPLRAELSLERRTALAGRIRDLSVTAVLFLKHLDSVAFDVRAAGADSRVEWQLTRARRIDDEWVDSAGMSESGVYRVRVESGRGQGWNFLVSHDRDVEIGEHRAGTDPVRWRDIQYAEVSVAAPWPPSADLPGDWQRFHVFLPTGERSPYRLLVNGAFATDLSRQQVRVTDDPGDYNAHLVREAARLIRDPLLETMRNEGAQDTELLAVLDRRESRLAGQPGIAETLHAAVREALADAPLWPTETGDAIAVSGCTVPPLRGTGLGGSFRHLLGVDPRAGGRRFPVAELCELDPATVLVDLGATEVGLSQAAELLEGADERRSYLRPHESGKFQVDPVLDVLERLWLATTPAERGEFEETVRGRALFPVDADGTTVLRTPVSATACFYPPRALAGTVPLTRMHFMLHEVCWGTLGKQERGDALRHQLPAWQALFRVKDFNFADVMTASVLPALVLDPGEDQDQLLEELRSPQRLAAICQMSGRRPKPAAPLPYERLGSERTISNLASLPVPCRGEPGFEWHPAFRVYFGTDWIGDDSVEWAIEMARSKGEVALQDVHFLAPPTYLNRYLKQYEFLRGSDDDAGDLEDEIALGEDEDVGLEEGRDRWLAFLTWIGVNRALRPVHFQDVEERAGGWLSTADLAKPQGHAFRNTAGVWDAYRDYVSSVVERRDPARARRPYFYQLHNLEFFGPLAQAARQDSTVAAAGALYEHLARNWGQLEPFARAQLALVPRGEDPGRRKKPPRAAEDELASIVENFWVFRMRRWSVVPTTHGPRSPTESWLPSEELHRRFGRLDQEHGTLLPVVAVPDELLRGRALSFAQALGIRSSLSGSTFTTNDARVVLEGIRDRYESQWQGHPPEDKLRRVIRPALRSLLDLLANAPPDTEDDLSLADAPVLATDGNGNYRFADAESIYYLDRRGTRQRLGLGSDFWTFELEAHSNASAPLARFFGMRTLEQVVQSEPVPGEASLSPRELARFRAGLRALAPYLLLRLRSNRNEDRDARQMRSFVEGIEPVSSLEVRALLDERPVAPMAPRESFVRDQRGSFLGFVRWGPNGWKPLPAEAEALATALADLYEPSLFESFHALITAPDDEFRMKLLRLAGAPTDLAGAIADLVPSPGGDAEPSGESAPPDERTPRDAPEDDEAEAHDQPDRSNARIPLYAPSQLVIAGEAVLLTGPGAEGSTKDDDHRDDGGEGRGSKGGWAKGLTDLPELDRLGMSVAMKYEQFRLRGEGQPDATIFDVDSPQDPGALVFNVSTVEAIEAARHGSERCREVLEYLAGQGLPRHHPGFDILTLQLDGTWRPGRMIELKSSGVNALTQSMTWNEWKTAQVSPLRRFFYLYLVGNLRSDLRGAAPFIRTIHDPFATLWQREEVETIHRSIQLNVRDFTEARHLDLEVIAAAEPGGAGRES